MAEPKTQKNDGSVTDFINSIGDETKRQDSLKLVKIFQECTGEEATMWGGSIVGFGQYHYKSEHSSQESEWMMTGFSPRKANLTIYIIPGFDNYKDDLAKLGKHTTSKSCIYIKRLGDVDEKILRKIIKAAYVKMKKDY